MVYKNIPLAAVCQNDGDLVNVVGLVVLEEDDRRAAGEDLGDFGVRVDGRERDWRPDREVPRVLGEVYLLVHRLDDFEVLQLFGLRHLLVRALFHGFR